MHIIDVIALDYEIILCYCPIVVSYICEYNNNNDDDGNETLFE